MESAIRYTAIGDSLTVGFGAPPGLGFADRYRTLAEEQLSRSVVLNNRGVNGMKATEIFTAIQTDSSMQAAIRSADLLTITAGGNDMLHAADLFMTNGDRNILKQTLKACKQSYADIFASITLCKAGQPNPYVIRVIELYNPIPAFSESVFWVSLFNKMLRQHKIPNLRVAHVYDAFLGKEGGLLSDDCIHPNAQGYRLIAEKTAACGWGVLDKKSTS